MNSHNAPACFRLVAALALSSCALPLFALTPGQPVPPPAPGQKPQLPYLAAEDSAKLFELPPGYHLQLVLSDPLIQDPVVTVFDGNGRMFVAEMRSYMQDADANGEKNPVSRVSLHWSSKGDGVYDKHTVFIDKMVLPRMILPLKDSVLIQETFTGDVYEYSDSKHDGVADTKKLFYKFDLPRDNNLEHQPSGLVWSQDNWIYSTYNAVRIRWTPKGAITENTKPNGGQWGMTQDNYGKTWVSNAGSDRGPLNFQVPIVYGAFSAPNEEAAGYRTVWPLIGYGDFQAGVKYVRQEDDTLNRTTSAAGLDIYRGDRLPADLQGDLLYGEPVGRLVRRTKITVKDGLTTISNAYDKSEFIRTKDAFFRPVNMITAPDGTIYITDMYRGIIQQGNWTRPGSYLRGKIDEYGMADKINGGRIWRLVYDGMSPGPQPHMLDETPAQLVAHLGHPNGWWRDTAQKLIILSQDKTVVPALQALARTSTNPLARIHAIWTLEGLDALDEPFVKEMFKDKDAHVKVAAIRASESLFKKGQTAVEADLVALLTLNKNTDVAIQGMMTATLLKYPEAEALVAQAPLTNTASGVSFVATQLKNSLISPFGPQFTTAQRQQLEHGQTIFLQLCFACHGYDGKGAPLVGKPGLTTAPPLSGSLTATGYRSGIILAVLHGLSGPIAGNTYDAQMLALGGNEDNWIADVTSYVRNSFGNQASLITADDVAAVRAANPARKVAWTLPELATRLPQPLKNSASWKITTNRPATADGATAAETGPATLSFTAKAPVTGAWLQIELPEAATISGLRISSAKSPTNFTRAYQVQLSTDGQTWGAPVATGQGTGALVDIDIPTTSTKWIRVTHTEPPVIVPDAGARGGRGGVRGGGGRRGNGAPAVVQGPPNWTVDDIQIYQPVSNVTSAK